MVAIELREIQRVAHKAGLLPHEVMRLTLLEFRLLRWLLDA